MGEDNRLPLQAPALKVDQQKSRVDFRTALPGPLESGFCLVTSPLLLPGSVHWRYANVHDVKQIFTENSPESWRMLNLVFYRAQAHIDPLIPLSSIIN